MKTKSIQCPSCTGSKDMPLCSDIFHSPEEVQRTNDVPDGAEPSRGAPNATAEQFHKQWDASQINAPSKYYWYNMAEAYAKAGHVVLLEALKEMRDVNAACTRVIVMAGLTRKLGDELLKAKIANGFGARAEAAIKQAERT